MRRAMLLSVSLPFLIGTCISVDFIRGGYDLELRVTYVATGEPVSGAQVRLGFCPDLDMGCISSTVYTLATDSTGSVVASEILGSGCDTEVENILVVIITDSEASEQFELMTAPGENRDLAEVNQFLGLRSDGSRFAVEVIGCVDDFVPPQGTCG